MMQKRLSCLCLAAMAGTLYACTPQPDSGPVQEGQSAADSDSAVKERAKSIEEAADQAVKLIEEDAKAEVDASKASQQEAEPAAE